MAILHTKVQAAKAQISRLLGRVRRGKPVASPVREARPDVPRMGMDAGLFDISEDFDDLPEGFHEAFRSE